jgi:hypothetical protein
VLAVGSELVSGWRGEEGGGEVPGQVHEVSRFGEEG